jgi:hypothetical protein
MKTTTLNADSFRDALEYFRDTEQRFTIERTGYTAAIKTEKGKKYLFTDAPVKLRLFGLFQRLKKEVSGKQLPEVNRAGVKYYSFKDAMKYEELPKAAHSIDISSAYVTALFNAGVISEAMNKELRELPKADRLKVVGMLATTKTVIHYDRGNVTEVFTERSPTSNVFFYACDQVGQAMETVRNIDGHLFYWVDGAFFERNEEQVAEHFRALGYATKIEAVTDLKFSPTRKHLFYTKDGERKYLAIPHKREAAPWIVNLVNQPPKQ